MSNLPAKVTIISELSKINPEKNAPPKLRRGRVVKNPPP